MNMDMDAVSGAMFWVGAMFVLTPMLFAGVILGIWWYTRKRDASRAAAEGVPDPQP